MDKIILNNGLVISGLGERERSAHLAALESHPGFEVMKDEFEKAVRALELEIFDRRKPLGERDVLTAAREKIIERFSPQRIVQSAVRKFDRSG